jgi:hypothetical protein
LCSVKGFPPATKVREDGAIKYAFMDDNGGSWEFLGMQDEVLVSWYIYDGAASTIDSGSTEYQLPNFADIISRLER